MRLLLFIFLIGIYSFTIHAENQKVIKFKQESVEEETEDEMIPFLLNEVFPAFGGFESLVLSSKPSFSFHFNNGGLNLTSCSVKAKVKQLDTIHYSLIEEETHEFQVEMDIGEPRWLFLELSCGEQNRVINTNHFNISFFVADENLNPANYSIRVKTLDQEQLNVKLESIDMEVLMQSEEQEMLLGPYGGIEEYSSEFKTYRQENNFYRLPLSLWSQQGNPVTIPSSHQEDVQIELKKINVVQTITLNGNVHILFPTSIDGVKQETKTTVPITGTIYVTDTDEYIPAINFSM